MAIKSEKEVTLFPGGNGAVQPEDEQLLPALDDMTPREIVAELDKYIVGQAAAKFSKEGATSHLTSDGLS